MSITTSLFLIYNKILFSPPPLERVEVRTKKLKMKPFKLNTFHKKILADTITPVSVYLKMRDKYPNSLLLESSDYRGNDNSFSYICCNPIASIKIENEIVTQNFPDGNTLKFEVTNATNVPEVIQDFASQFQSQKNDFKFINNGLFGYISYDAVRYFEKIEIAKKQNNLEIPEIGRAHV